MEEEVIAINTSFPFPSDIASAEAGDDEEEEDLVFAPSIPTASSLRLSPSLARAGFCALVNINMSTSSRPYYTLLPTSITLPQTSTTRCSKHQLSSQSPRIIYLVIHPTRTRDARTSTPCWCRIRGTHFRSLPTSVRYIMERDPKVHLKHNEYSAPDTSHRTSMKQHQP